VRSFVSSRIVKHKVEESCLLFLIVTFETELVFDPTNPEKTRQFEMSKDMERT
jgi:hypothetical protein